MRKAKDRKSLRKDRVVNVRMTSDDIIEIMRLSRDNKVSVSELIRQRVLNLNPNRNKNK